MSVYRVGSFGSTYNDAISFDFDIFLLSLSLVDLNPMIFSIDIGQLLRRVTLDVDFSTTTRK
jgi:hypothetical protein